jgi:hypothetical protein
MMRIVITNTDTPENSDVVLFPGLLRCYAWFLYVMQYNMTSRDVRRLFVVYRTYFQSTQQSGSSREYISSDGDYNSRMMYHVLVAVVRYCRDILRRFAVCYQIAILIVSKWGGDDNGADWCDTGSDRDGAGV